MKINFVELTAVKSKPDAVLIFPVGEDKKLGAFATVIDKQSGGLLTKALAGAKFTGKRGQFICLATPKAVKAERVILAGVGAIKTLDVKALQNLLIANEEMLVDACPDREITNRFEDFLRDDRKNLGILDTVIVQYGIKAEPKESMQKEIEQVETMMKGSDLTLFEKVAKHELFGDGIGAPGSGAETYTDMLITNTRTIVQGLGGKFTPIDSKVSLLP